MIYNISINKMSQNKEIENYLKLTKLEAKGRIPKEQTDVKFKKSKEIDGVKLESYDDCCDVIKIRADDSENLPFWLEIEIPMKQLQDWLRAEQGIEMTFCKLEGK